MANKVEKQLFVFTCSVLQTVYIIYRLLREVFRQVMVIFKKFRSSAYKIKWWDNIHEESSDVNSSKWSEHIPQDIVELILQRLPLNDYIRFGTICSSWRYAVAQVIAEEYCSPRPEVPLLMFCGHPYMNTEHCFLNLSTQKVSYKPSCSELQWRHCVGTVNGWLILSDNIMWRPEGFMDFYGKSSFEKIKNFFLNPVSRARMMLPSLTTIPLPQRSQCRFFVKVVASAVPTSPNCVVVGVFLKGPLVFCRPGDNSWTLYENKKWFWLDIVFHDRLLYAISSESMGSVMVFDFRRFSRGNKSHPIIEILAVLPPMPVKYSRTRMEGHITYYYDVAMINLVKDHASGDLLMIKRIFDAAIDDESVLRPILGCEDFKILPRIKYFEVFKWDRKCGQRWKPVHFLGDRVVFLSNRSCTILSTASIGEHEKGVRGNRIYFAIDNMCNMSTTSPQEGRDMGVYCLNHQRIRRNLPSVTRSWLTLNPFWFTPNPW